MDPNYVFQTAWNYMVRVERLEATYLHGCEPKTKSGSFFGAFTEKSAGFGRFCLKQTETGKKRKKNKTKQNP